MRRVLSPTSPPVLSLRQVREPSAQISVTREKRHPRRLGGPRRSTRLVFPEQR
jgi:hypothetical protein